MLRRDFWLSSQVYQFLAFLCRKSCTLWSFYWQIYGVCFIRYSDNHSYDMHLLCQYRYSLVWFRYPGYGATARLRQTIERAKRKRSKLVLSIKDSMLSLRNLFLTLLMSPFFKRGKRNKLILTLIIWVMMLPILKEWVRDLTVLTLLDRVLKLKGRSIGKLVN